MVCMEGDHLQRQVPKKCGYVATDTTIIKAVTVRSARRCEQERKPDNGFLSKLSAPARRALEHHGISTLQQLSAFSEKEILQFHGIGPAFLRIFSVLWRKLDNLFSTLKK